MKAYLLAGGLGERLRPLTLRMPKCLVPIAGEPVLGHWLDLLDRHGVERVLINVSQHPDQVERFLATRSGGPQATLVHEESPLGNAGTVAANREFVSGERDFWICYSDTLTDVDLAAMHRAHGRHDDVLTMGLFHAPVPEAAGIVVVDGGGRVTDFQEKPARPATDLANAGIYLARQTLFDAIPRGDGVIDFGFDVFPALLGRIHGVALRGFVKDIGTPAALEQAGREWTLRRGEPGS